MKSSKTKKSSSLPPDLNKVLLMVAVVAALTLVVFAGIGSLYGG